MPIMNSKGEMKTMLSTNERIAIAQCINLAVSIEPTANDERLKALVKRMHKLKMNLEQEYSMNGNKF